MKELVEDSSDEALKNEENGMREVEGMERTESGNKSNLHRQRSRSALGQRMGNVTPQTAHRLRSHLVEREREEMGQGNTQREG